MFEQSFQQALFADDDFRRAVHHFQQGRLFVGHTDANSTNKCNGLVGLR